MMYQYKFEKILNVREKEKQDASAKYHEDIKRFEEAAEKLYRLLKKKEDLLNFQQEKLRTGLAVQEIRHHQQFMDNLEKLIDNCQSEVIKARMRMNASQEKLMEKNMEVRKFEKIREKDFTKFLDELKETENKNMDEISIRQFINKDN